MEFFSVLPIRSFSQNLGTERLNERMLSLPVSAGDPLSQNSLLQSLSANLLTFCWEVKIPSLNPNFHKPSHCHPHPKIPFFFFFLLLTNSGRKKKKTGPDGDCVPSCIVHVNMCPCWFGPCGIPPQSLGKETQCIAQCIDWLIRWKTL